MLIVIDCHQCNIPCCIAFTFYNKAEKCFYSEKKPANVAARKSGRLKFTDTIIRILRA